MEMREAIAFTIDDRQYDETKIPNDLTRLVRACGNLVLIDEGTQEVQFAHYTVQQYFLEQERAASSSFRITREDADVHRGELCVAFLSFSDFETQVVKHSNTLGSNLAQLESLVTTQTLLPQNSAGASVAKFLTRIRADGKLLLRTSNFPAISVWQRTIGQSIDSRRNTLCSHISLNIGFFTQVDFRVLSSQVAKLSLAPSNSSGLLCSKRSSCSISGLGTDPLGRMASVVPGQWLGLLPTTMSWYHI